MALLEAKNITKRFGGLTAVNDVSLTVEDQSIVSVIGPNGAGKTTFFNIITGIYHPDQGAIGLADRSVVGLRPDQIASLGITRTFQNIRLFNNMTVLENVLVGMHPRLKIGVWQILARARGFHREEHEATDKALNCSSLSACAIAPTIWRVAWRMVSSAGSRSGARWRPIPS